MTLHHIRDVPLVLGRLAALLKPGGWLAAADLDTEDGSFHGNAEDVFHHGFEQSQITKWFTEAGLSATCVSNAHSITKPASTGELRTYSVFLAVGKKDPCR